MSNDPRGHIAELMRWLENAGPDDWHKVAQSWNWDSDIAPLWWIVRQPSCDKATALIIFWNTDAQFYLEFANREEAGRGNPEHYDLMCEIRQRWLDGKYVRSELAYDPVARGPARALEKYEAQLGPRLKFKIPRDMVQALTGRTVDSRGFVEGFPPEVAAAKH